MTQDAHSIHALQISDTLQTNSQHLGNEVTLFDDISWNDLAETPTQIGFLLIALCTEGEASFTINGNVQYMKKAIWLYHLETKCLTSSTLMKIFMAKPC